MHVVLVGLARKFLSHFTIFHQPTIGPEKRLPVINTWTQTPKKMWFLLSWELTNLRARRSPTNIVTCSTGQVPTDSSTSPHHLLGTLAKRPISCASECLRATLLAPNINSCWPVRSRPPRQGKIAEIFGDFLHHLRIGKKSVESFLLNF